MRIYFAPCGIGLGHVGRSLPIASKLKDQGAEILFSTYGDAVGYLGRKEFPFVEAPSIGYSVKPTGGIDFRATATGIFSGLLRFTRQVNAEIKYIEQFEPDIVFSDTRASSIVAAKMLRVKRIAMLNMFSPTVPRKRRLFRLSKIADMGIVTMLGRIWTMSNRVLMCDFPPPYTISEQNFLIPDRYRKKVSFVGPIIAKRPEELPDKERLRKKLGLDPSKYAIFSPVSGPEREKAYLTEALKEIYAGFPDRYQIVMSLGHPAQTLTHKEGGLSVFSWLPERLEYLKACDVVVARAGHETVSQAMVYGKPIVLIPTPGQTEQYGNARRALGMGIAAVVEQDDLTLQSLLSTVDGVLEDRLLERGVKDVQGKVGEFDGVKKVVETIFETLRS